MNLITDNPIIEEVSNCCGNSSADGMPTAGRCGNPRCPYARKGIPCPYRMKGMACGYGRRRRMRGAQMVKDDLAGRPVIIQQKSSFDDYSGAEGETYGQEVKRFMKEGREARKESRIRAVGDTLLGARSRGETRRGAKEVRRAERLTQKEARQSERIANRKARAQRRSDRKAKRNAQKLVLIQRTRTSEPKFFFPLQKLRLSKRKKGAYTKTFPDGQEVDIAATAVLTDSEGNVYSASDVSKATNIPEQTLQGKTLTNSGVQDPTTGQTFELSATTNSQGQTTLGIEVNDANVSGAMDGEAYLASDVQGSSEPTKDVKAEDEKKAEGTGMSKTQKWVLGIGAAVVVGLVVYALVKNKKSPAGAAASTGGSTLSKVA